MGEAAARRRLHCRRCGEVTVRTCEVEVHANPREDFALYTFRCPGCRELVVGGCRETIDALLLEGARRLELRSTSAPPLTYDDLLDFHEWLARDLPWPTTP
jgi:hypothetical protein